jgi:hypothetical protein
MIGVREAANGESQTISAAKWTSRRHPLEKDAMSGELDALRHLYGSEELQEVLKRYLNQSAKSSGKKHVSLEPVMIDMLVDWLFLTAEFIVASRGGVSKGALAIYLASKTGMFLNLSQDKRMACGAALISLTSTTALAAVATPTVIGAVVFSAFLVLDALEVYDKCVVDLRPALSPVRARAMMCLAPGEGAAPL